MTTLDPLANKVVQIVLDSMPVEAERVVPAAKLSDLGYGTEFDETLFLAMNLEEAFDIDIDDEEKWVTIQDVIDSVRRRV
jgi:acyl carrier protein